MEKNRQRIIIGLTLALSLLGLLLALNAGSLSQKSSSKETRVTKEEVAKKKHREEQASFAEKSQADKDAAMAADLPTMEAVGLYYDYAHLTLPEVVQAYLDERGLDHSKVAFSYKNTKTNQVISMNETQPMTAGSTYKLPLNMVIVDQVAKGQFSIEEEYDITQVDYEYIGEYNAYRSQFGDGMTIPEMQEYSLVYSENTPAIAMVNMLGGYEKAYKLFSRYGKSKGDIKTIDVASGNKTTTDFYIQVLDKLWKNQDKYADILACLNNSFPGLYYEEYLPYINILQKPGYVREALNIDAIVYEETPYLIALYTAELGYATVNSSEVDGLGYNQLSQLAYVINQWHRVNQN